MKWEFDGQDDSRWFQYVLWYQNISCAQFQTIFYNSITLIKDNNCNLG